MEKLLKSSAFILLLSIFSATSAEVNTGKKVYIGFGVDAVFSPSQTDSVSSLKIEDEVYAGDIDNKNNKIYVEDEKYAENKVYAEDIDNKYTENKVYAESVNNNSNNSNTNNNTESKIYVGFGAASISGSSQTDDISSLRTPLITVGYKVANSIAIELSSTVGNPTDSGYKLDRSTSLSVVGSTHINSGFSLLGKLGVNQTDFTRDNGGELQALDMNYGIGMRYDINNSLFVDGMYEQITDKEIDNRTEDFTKASIELKYSF